MQLPLKLNAEPPQLLLGREADNFRAIAAAAVAAATKAHQLVHLRRHLRPAAVVAIVALAAAATAKTLPTQRRLQQPPQDCPRSQTQLPLKLNAEPPQLLLGREANNLRAVAATVVVLAAAAAVASGNKRSQSMQRKSGFREP
jgi:hypothetical protein